MIHYDPLLRFEPKSPCLGIFGHLERVNQRHLCRAGRKGSERIEVAHPFRMRNLFAPRPERTCIISETLLSIYKAKTKHLTFEIDGKSGFAFVAGQDQYLTPRSGTP